MCSKKRRNPLRGPCFQSFGRVILLFTRSVGYCPTWSAGSLAADRQGIKGNLVWVRAVTNASQGAWDSQWPPRGGFNQKRVTAPGSMSAERVPIRRNEDSADQQGAKGVHSPWRVYNSSCPSESPPPDLSEARTDFIMPRPSLLAFAVASSLSFWSFS